MRYLITGGCGFLGTNLALRLLHENADVVIFDDLSRNGSLENLDFLTTQGVFEFIEGDISEKVEVENLIRNYTPDRIFHLAGQVAMTTSIENPIRDLQINTVGTINLLESVRQYSPESVIIYSSTNKVYGDLEYIGYSEDVKRFSPLRYKMGFNEEISLNFQSPYGCSKGAADQYLLDYHRIYGLKTIVFRHSSMYGGRQFSTFDQGWLGWFAKQALEQKFHKGNSFTIAGNGKQVRDVLHVSDVVNLYLLASENSDSLIGEAFNVGGGIQNSLSLLELFDILERELDIKLNYTITPSRISDQKFFVADNEKIYKLTGWVPQTSSTDGIKSLLNWLEK